MTLTPERTLELAIEACREKARDLLRVGSADASAGADLCADMLSERLALAKFAEAWVRKGGSVDLFTVDPEKLSKATP